MYQWRKDIAQWRVGNMLYLSVPFTWLLAPNGVNHRHGRRDEEA